MEHVIENDKLRVTVSDLGAEIRSIYGKTTNFEYLWQGNPEYWKGRATVLFPICGRLTDGKYTYKGKEYRMVLHGFARNREFSVAEKTAEKLVLELKSDEKTLEIYPFEFDFKVTYTLDGATVRTAYTVENTGKENMRFSVGGHPGFNIPLKDGAAFEDHYLEFKNAKACDKLVMSETCYYTGKKEPFPLKDGRILELKHSLFDNDAIFLDGMDDTVTLKCKNGGRNVTVHFNDMTHLGFWHKPHSNAPYVCIEPWRGVPAYDNIVDDFATKAELLEIPAGRKYDTFFDITVSE